MSLKLFIKSTTSHTIRSYFGASWELWKREINQTLWDWGIDGPFCNDPHCGQRLMPIKQGAGKWMCIRCGLMSTLPGEDFPMLRSRIIRFFEEESREKQLV